MSGYTLKYKRVNQGWETRLNGISEMRLFKFGLGTITCNRSLIAEDVSVAYNAVVDSNTQEGGGDS